MKYILSFGFIMFVVAIIRALFLSATSEYPNIDDVKPWKYTESITGEQDSDD